MTTVVLGCDVNNGNDSKWQNTIESMLTKAGYKVKKLQIHPTPFGSYSYSSAAKGKIGAINNVFGGGNAAAVKGNTNVNIGTTEYEKVTSVIDGKTNIKGLYTRSGTEGNYTYTEVADDEAVSTSTTYYMRVKGVDIRGNVYGGGNNAAVTGNTNVQIGKKAE